MILTVLSPVQVPPYLGILAGLRRRTPRGFPVALCHNVLPHERKPYDTPLMKALLRRVGGVLVHSEPQAALARELGPAPVTVAEMAPHLPVSPVPQGRGQADGVAGPAAVLRPGPAVQGTGPADPRAAAPRGVSLRVAGEFWGGLEGDQGADRRAGPDRAGGAAAGLRPADDDVPGLFADVDALVLPYRSGTASQQGVVRSRARGAGDRHPGGDTRRDHVTDGVDGLLCTPGDAADLARAIGQLYQPGTLARLRAGARPADPGPLWDDYLAAITKAIPAANA